VSFTWTVKPAPDSGPTGAVRMGGTYGKCLDDSADSSASGTKIQAWTCNGSAAQQWTFAEDGTLRIHGKCLDVGGDGKSQNSPIMLESCTGTPAEQWVLLESMVLQPSTSTVYCLLDPATSLTKNGVQLVLGTCKLSAAQWSLPAGPVLSAIPGKCLDDYKGLTANGSKVDLSSCNGSKTQQWTAGTDTTIRIGGKCLTRHTANGTVGEVAHLWTCDGQANQHWYLFGMPAWESSPFAVHFLPATNTLGGLCLAAPASLAASPALVTTTATGCEDPDLTTTWRVW
jgi:hypothetical protein